jgi:hypothetical protein
MSEKKPITNAGGYPPMALSLGIRAQGRLDLENHMKGVRLTQREAIKAKCYDCMGGYTDGKADCAIPGCSLYPYNPYRGYNPAIGEGEEPETPESGV